MGKLGWIGINLSQIDYDIFGKWKWKWEVVQATVVSDNTNTNILIETNSHIKDSFFE
jgi:hypothetical protein